MVLIKLTQGKSTIVDESDFDRLNQWKWCYNGIYAVRTQRMRGARATKTIYMHKLICSGEVVDHINQNPLDNRKSNLRACTHAQNMRNRKLAINNKSGFIGVHWNKRKLKWRAEARMHNKPMFLGYFEKPEEAAKVRNQFVKSNYGVFAVLNKGE